MVDIGPYGPPPDDPVLALTDTDKQWLRAHGWDDPTIERPAPVLFPLFALTLDRQR